MRKVDGGLSANRRVDHGKKACRHLHELAASHVRCCGKARKIADNAAAKRYNHIVTRELGFGAMFEQTRKLGHVLDGFGRLYDMDMRIVPGISKRFEDGRGVERGDIGVRHDHRLTAFGAFANDGSYAW